MFRSQFFEGKAILKNMIVNSLLMSHDQLCHTIDFISIHLFTFLQAVAMVAFRKVTMKSKWMDHFFVVGFYIYIYICHYLKQKLLRDSKLVKRHVLVKLSLLINHDITDFDLKHKRI